MSLPAALRKPDTSARVFSYVAPRTDAKADCNPGAMDFLARLVSNVEGRSTPMSGMRQQDGAYLCEVTPAENIRIWLPSVSRRGWQRGSRLAIGGSGK